MRCISVLILLSLVFFACSDEQTITIMNYEGDNGVRITKLLYSTGNILDSTVWSFSRRAFYSTAPKCSVEWKDDQQIIHCEIFSFDNIVSVKSNNFAVWSGTDDHGNRIPIKNVRIDEIYINREELGVGPLVKSGTLPVTLY